MLSVTTEIRVRYPDVDQMQFVYNGKYLEYFDVARTEMVRSTGLVYAELEKQGYALPVIEANIKYRKPARYDEIIQVTASVAKRLSAKVHITYEVKRKTTGEILTEGYTDLMFINVETKRPVKPPKVFLDALKPYFED